MPLYTFQNPDNEDEIEEVYFKMNDEKKHIVNGVEWNRIYTKPNASIHTQVDPFSLNDFRKATTNKKLTVGDLMDKSAELSEKRAEKNNGLDPIKEKMYSDYEKTTGKKHADVKKREAVEKCKNLGFSVNI